MRDRLRSDPGREPRREPSHEPDPRGPPRSRHGSDRGRLRAESETAPRDDSPEAPVRTDTFDDSMPDDKHAAPPTAGSSGSSGSDDVRHWNPDIDAMVRGVARRHSACGWIHDWMATDAKRWGNRLTISNGVLGGVVGSIGLAFGARGAPPAWAAFTSAGVGFIVSVVAAVTNAWKLPEEQAANTALAAAHLAAARAIGGVLARDPADRPDAVEHLSGVLEEFTRLRDGAPPFSSGARRAYSARFGVAFDAGEWAATPEDAAGAESWWRARNARAARARAARRAARGAAVADLETPNSSPAGTLAPRPRRTHHLLDGFRRTISRRAPSPSPPQTPVSVAESPPDPLARLGEMLEAWRAAQAVARGNAPHPNAHPIGPPAEVRPLTPPTPHTPPHTSPPHTSPPHTSPPHTSPPAPVHTSPPHTSPPARVRPSVPRAFVFGSGAVNDVRESEL